MTDAKEITTERAGRCGLGKLRPVTVAGGGVSWAQWAASVAVAGRLVSTCSRCLVGLLLPRKGVGEAVGPSTGPRSMVGLPAAFSAALDAGITPASSPAGPVAVVRIQAAGR